MKEKVKNKGGRPTKYTEEYPTKVYEFLDECNKREVVPLLIDLCRKMGLKATEISKYANRYPRFNKAIEALKQESESYLIHKAMNRKIDPNFAKFILAANYGYVETSKTITEGSKEPVIVTVDMGTGYKAPVTTTSPAVSPTEAKKPS